VYDTDAFTGTIPNQQSGFGTASISYPSNGIQNGSPDGIALVNGATVVQFLSYEGSFIATNGPANGMSSTDIGVSEAGSEPVGMSLQLQGSGTTYEDFTWTATPIANTQNAVNTGQTLGGGDAAPSVTTTSPIAGAAGVARNSNVGITFSEDVDVVPDSWYQISCGNTGGHSATVTGGPAVFTLDPTIDFGSNEICTVTVFAAQVMDQDLNDPPDSMAGDHVFSFTTVDDSVCGDPATFIHTIQGTGLQSTMTGQVQTIEGIVVGDYQATPSQFGGYHVQEEDADADALPTTSEGIFVVSTTPVNQGDLVRITGTVTETSIGGGGFLTELRTTSNLLLCSTGNTVAPTIVTLPVLAISDWERYESMLIVIDQDLTVTETFTLGRFGEVALSVGGRLANPTNVVDPGAQANALQDLNDRSRILLDDANNQQNIDPTRYPAGGLSASNTLRIGDSLGDVTGVLEQRFSVYRIQPVSDIDFDPTNPRPAAPEPVGGNLQVAAFNVLNYFTTLDTNPGSGNGPNICGPTGGLECRGANSAFELQRQRDKIVSAMIALDADVLGLMELENNPSAAIQDLVNGLNAVAGPGTYTFIDTGTIGTDAIKVGLIYKAAVVTPVGPYAILDSSVDSRFIDTRSRPSLAQTFELNANGERLTIDVNHLKSKGSACTGAPLNDPDTGDGQGNCNLTRTLAAEALVDWLATDPTASGDPDVIVIGDLNSYAMEDPIGVFEDADYTNTIASFIGLDAYSFVFQGQSGYLDHALAGETLTPQVNDVAEWHINADEPVVLDYNTDFKSANHVITLYAPTPYRSSDHDPVVIGIDLGRCLFTDNVLTRTRTLLGDCTTSETIHVPDGWTLDGDGHSITAYDPEGGHFLGAVVDNAGDEAHVRDLTVTTYQLADVCDAGADRLRGILFDGAAGSITNNHVIDLNQGFSGCQEGNAIEVRNEPFDTTGTDLDVTISGNEITDYQKTGIVANGSVFATILGNEVVGWGPTDVIAQNGIQIGFGGRAFIRANSVSGNVYTGPDVACGLLLFQADGVKQQANTLFANEQNLCNFGRGGGNVKPGK
jgi:predicted extracellular nuclease